MKNPFEYVKDVIKAGVVTGVMLAGAGSLDASSTEGGTEKGIDPTKTKSEAVADTATTSTAENPYVFSAEDLVVDSLMNIPAKNISFLLDHTVKNGGGNSIQGYNIKGVSGKTVDILYDSGIGMDVKIEYPNGTVVNGFAQAGGTTGSGTEGTEITVAIDVEERDNVDLNILPKAVKLVDHVSK